MLLKGNEKTEEVADTVDKGLKLDDKTSKAQSSFWSHIEEANTKAERQRTEQIKQNNKLVDLATKTEAQERNIVNRRILGELGKQALALNALVENSAQQLVVAGDHLARVEEGQDTPSPTQEPLLQGNRPKG
jgi:hypothetical protein